MMEKNPWKDYTPEWSLFREWSFLEAKAEIADKEAEKNRTDAQRFREKAEPYRIALKNMDKPVKKDAP